MILSLKTGNVHRGFFWVSVRTFSWYSNKKIWSKRTVVFAAPYKAVLDGALVAPEFYQNCRGAITCYTTCCLVIDRALHLSGVPVSS